jgi:hypothetical protein
MMSLTKELLNEINRANAAKSTGPRSTPGKQRSSMNAVKHNLSGQHLILLATETEAYNRVATASEEAILGTPLVGARLFLL